MRRSYTAIQGDILRSREHPKGVVGLELKLLDLAKLVRTAQECQQQSDLLRGLQEQQLLEGMQALQAQLHQLQSVVFAKPPTSCSFQSRASLARSSAGISAAALAAPAPSGAPAPLITGGASERHHAAGHLAVVVPDGNGARSADCAQPCGEQLLLARRSEMEALAARLEAIERNLEHTALEARQVEEAREQSEVLVLERLIALECSVACAIAQPAGASGQQQQQPDQHRHPPQLEEDIRQLRRRLDALAARVGTALAWLDSGEDDGSGDRLPAAASARGAAKGEEDARGVGRPPATASARVAAAAEGAEDAVGDQVAPAPAKLGTAATVAKDLGVRPEAGAWMATGCDSLAACGQGCSAGLTVERPGGSADGLAAHSTTQQHWVADGDYRGMAPEGSRSTGPGAVVGGGSVEALMLLPARLQAAVDRTAQAAVAGALKAWNPFTSTGSDTESLHLREALGAVQGLSVAQQALSSSLGRLEALCPRLLTTLNGLQSCNASGSTGGGDEALVPEGDAAEGGGPQARAPGGAHGPHRGPQLREAYALAQEAGGLVAGLKKTLAEAMVKGHPGAACLSRDPSTGTAGAPTEPPTSTLTSSSQEEAPSGSKVRQQPACILPNMPHTTSLASKPGVDVPAPEAERPEPASLEPGRPTGGHTQGRGAQALAAPAQGQGPPADPVGPAPGPRPTPGVPPNAPPGAVDASQAAPPWTGCSPVAASAPVTLGPVSPLEGSESGAASVISLSQLAAPRGATTVAAVQHAQQHPKPPASVPMGMAAGELSLGPEPSHQPPPQQQQKQQQQSGVRVIGEAPPSVFAPAPFLGVALRSTEQRAEGVAQHSSAPLHPQQQAAGPPRSTVARAINFTAPSAGVVRGAGPNNEASHGAGVASATASDAYTDSTSRFEPHAARHAGTAQPPALRAPGVHGVPPLLQNQQTQTSTEARGSAAPQDNTPQGYFGAGSCLASVLPRNLAADGRREARYTTLRKVPSGDSSRHLQDDVLLSSPPLSYDSQYSPRIQPLSRLAMAARRPDARRHNAPAASPTARCAAGRGLGVYGTYDAEDDVSRWGWLSDDEDERGEFEEGRRERQRCTTPPPAAATARSRKVQKSKSAAGAADAAARRTPRRRVTAGPRTPIGKAGAVRGPDATRDQTPVVLRAPWSGGKGRAGYEGTSPGRYAAGRRGAGPGAAGGGRRGVGNTKKGAASVLGHTRLLVVGAVKSPIKSH